MKIKLNDLPINEKISFIDLSKEITNFDQNLLKTYEYPPGGPSELYKEL